MSYSPEEIAAMTTYERTRLGLVYVMPKQEPKPFTEQWWVAGYNDWTLEAIYRDLSKRNLSNYANHATRELAQRLGAIRFERNYRIAQGTYQGKEILDACFPRKAA